MSEKNQNKTPQWLINIQENSWNVELFISIGFTFVLFKLPYITENISSHIIAQYGTFVNFGPCSAIIQIAVLVLPIGFITHLIFRGIWIGLVGFSFVFPEGIKTDKLNYPERYKRVILKSKDPTKFILKLETISSLIYTFTFLFFFILIAVFNYLLVTGAILEIIGNSINPNFVFIFFRYFFNIIGLIYAIDFFTAGFIKKNKITSRVFYPIYRIISVITLSVLYRTQYYTFITRYNKLKVSLILLSVFIGYITISFLTTIKTDKRILYSDTFHTEYLISASSVYESEIPEGELIRSACIQSDIIKDDFLKLLVPHKRYWEYQYTYNELSEISMKIDSLDQDGKIEETYKYIMSKYDQLYRVYLDDTLINNINWYFYLHPKTVAGGIITYVDIANLEKGHHQLRILLIDNAQISNIHFWKE